jgi:uncharacterized protein YodC (DUF2158 family)
MESETEALKTGDIVRLKSGGPDMTLQRESAERPGRWICTWFVNDEDLREGYFDLETLVKR